MRWCSTEDLAGRSFSWSLGFTGDSVYSQSSGRTKEVWSRLSNEKNASTLEGVNDYSAGKSALDGVWWRHWYKGKTCIKVFDKGRIYCLAFNNEKKIIEFFVAGIFSVDAHGVLREKYVYVTENQSVLKDSLQVFKSIISSDKKSFEQRNATGGTETWFRWGNPVK